MGAIGTIGIIDAKFSADTRQLDAGLESIAAKSDAAAKKIQVATQFAKLMGEQFDEIGPKTERAAAMQERAAERMRRAWQQEVQQQNRTIDAEQQAARAKELATLKSDILARSLENQAKAQLFVNSATRDSIPQYAAASGVVRALEGGMNNNIRAAERFLTTTLGLGPILQTLFPIAGALAFVDILGRMGEKVIGLIQNWEGLRDIENATMEAMAKADQSIVQAADEHTRMMREQRVTNAELNAPRDQREAAGALAGAQFDKAILTANANALKDQINGAMQAIRDANLVQRAEATRVVTKLGTAPGPFDPTKGPVTITAPTTDAQIAASELQRHNYQIEALQAQLRNVQAQLLIAGSQEALRQREVREGGARGERHDATQQMGVWRQRLETMKAAHAMNLDEEAAYWQKLADGAKRGSVLYNAALEEANKARATSQQQYQQQFVAGVIQGIDARTQQQESSDRINAALKERWDAAQKQDDEDAKQMLESAVKAFEEAERMRQAADKIAEERIKLDESMGRLSRLGAAQALQTLHAESFAQWSAASASFSANFPDTPVPGAAGALGQQGMQSAMDAAAVQSATALGSLDNAANELTQRFLDNARAAQIFDRAFGDFNKQVVDFLTMKHPRTDFGSVGANLFRGVTQMGVEHLEGTVMKMLGFGGGKKRQESNVWVQNWPGGSAGAGGGSSSASGPGGIIGKVLSFLGGGGAGGGAASVMAGTADPLGLVAPAAIDTSGLASLLPMFPMMAGGGPISSNMPAIVGERGPELFLPASSGRIVPNHELGGGAGGDMHLHIDARGANDPAATEAAVHRAMKQYVPKITAMSMAAQRDYNSRRPGTSRL